MLCFLLADREGVGGGAVNPENRIQLSRSVGGASNTALEAWTPTFADMTAALSQPEIGNKDGSYFVRGPFNGTAERGDDHITEANVVILDGDKRIDTATGELLVGAPHPQEVHDALRKHGIGHVIYTSHSHGLPGKGDRYRVVIPAPVGSERARLQAVVDHVIRILHGAGVMLAPAAENYGWSQAWYLPRIREKGAEFLHFSHHTDRRLDVAAITDEWKRFQPKFDEAEVHSERPKDRDGPIGRYVTEHGDPLKIAAMLEKHGYLLQQTGTLNAAPSYRFLAPGSGSGNPGVTLFRAKDGTWRTTSFHGEHDPLRELSPKDGRPLAHDAFDLLRILEHGGDLKAALRAIDLRPVIRVQGGKLDKVAQKAIGALAARSPPEIFQRGTALVKVAHLADAGDAHGVHMPEGSVILQPMDPVSLRVPMARAAIWQRGRKSRDGVEWYDTDPPQDIAATVLKMPGEWGDLPVLMGLAEAPILRPDGSVHDQRGYDPVTRLYHEGRAPRISRIKRHDLTLENARAAADRLLKPFAEFPFADPDIDRAVVLAYMLTLALRPMLPLAPLFAVSATAPGTGKGLLIEACNLLVRGRDPATMAPPSGQGADDEMRKRFTALLIQGAASVNLDNWTSTVGGNALNAFLTAEIWSDRVLGKSQSVSLPNRVTLACTGNNLIVRGDTVRRTLLASLDAGVERPELRDFKITNLQEYILKNRGSLLSCLYLILQAYKVAGEPEKDGKVLGRYEEWSRAVAAVIRWLGMPDPLDSQKRLRADDPETQRLGAFLEAWHEVFADEWVTIKQVMDEVDTFTPRHRPGGLKKFEALREAVEDVATSERGKISSKKLGWYCSKQKGRLCEGFHLEEDATTKRKRYRAVRIDHWLD